ncbi:MAG: hypothetical protein AB7I30_16200 [Isosphaeraceae bacterium]
MALKTSLRSLAKRIALAVQAAVRRESEALTKKYRLFGTYEAESDHISLVLQILGDVDDLRLYTAVFEELRRAFPHDPFIPNSVGLVIRHVSNEDEMGAFAYWPEAEEDISHLLQ